MTTRATANICNTRGLHARASAKFVKLASTFDAEVHVISGEGPDAEAAVAALSELVERKFDEDQ